MKDENFQNMRKEVAGGSLLNVERGPGSWKYSKFLNAFLELDYKRGTKGKKAMAQNAFDGLTAEQLEIVHGWIDKGRATREIADEMAKPAPEGFGIQVSHMAVSRYRKAQKRKKVMDELEEQEAMAAELLEIAGKGEVDYGQATMQILQRKVFSAATEAKGEVACEMMRKLVEMNQRAERIQLAEKNHELAKLRFEFNTAREVMKKAGAYLEIFRHPTMDNEEKVWEARRICFGTSAKEPARIEAGLTTEVTESRERKTEVDAKGEG